MLTRLVGLETEYAIRFHPDHPALDAAADYQLYHALLQTVAKRVLTVPAHDLKEGVFTETGGAIWFERVRFAGGFGLIEGSTPECRGPREVLLHQRAQDHLLTEAARDADVPGVLALVKNDCDSQGHIYGAQENYELTLAEGWRLRCWRWGLFGLFPFLLIAWVGYALLNVGLIVYLIFAAIFCGILSHYVKSEWSDRLQAFLLGEKLKGRTGYVSPIPEWVEVLGLGFIRIIAGPLALGIYLLMRWVGFHRVQRDLVPFLISRPVLAGAGFVDAQGRYQLSDKAWGMNCVLGYNGIVMDRPIFSIGHVFKSLMFRAWASPREFARLLAPRQRLQVCLGDSNMCEEAEYLRVGTTMLVLDAIEAGYFRDSFTIARPIKSLRKLSADATLSAQVRCSDGQSRTAWDIQQHYHQVCAKFVEESSTATGEARDILKRWGEVLELLRSNPDGLLGRLDWITKRFLLRQACEETAEQAVKKKIDIRYHELSTDGYFRQLETTGVIPSLLTTAEIEAAVHTPPQDTPATIRSRYLKEYGRSQARLKVNWHMITLGQGRTAKRIELAEESSPNRVGKE